MNQGYSGGNLQGGGLGGGIGPGDLGDHLKNIFMLDLYVFEDKSCYEMHYLGFPGRGINCNENKYCEMSRSPSD